MNAATSGNQFEAAARLRKAMALVAAVMGFAERHQLDPVELAGQCGAREKELFAKLAQVNLPSEKTWAVVVQAVREAREIVQAAGKKLCVVCGVGPATMEAGKSKRPGTTVCQFCWALDTDHDGDAR